GHLGTVDLRLAMKFPDPLEGTLEHDVEHELIARFDGFAKPRIVDCHEIKARIRVGHHFRSLECEDARGLRESLDDHDAGHDRAMREMPGKERLIEGNILD